MEIPSRRIKEKLMVTTSSHVLANMAEFGDDLEIEGYVLAAKRSHEDDDTSGGVLGRQHRLGVMQMLCPTSADAGDLTTNPDHR